MENYFPLQEEEEEEEGEKSSYVHIKHRIKDWIWQCQIRICSRTTGATYVAQIHAPSPHLPNKCYSPFIDDDESIQISWNSELKKKKKSHVNIQEVTRKLHCYPINNFT